MKAFQPSKHNGVLVVWLATLGMTILAATSSQAGPGGGFGGVGVGTGTGTAGASTGGGHGGAVVSGGGARSSGGFQPVNGGFGGTGTSFGTMHSTGSFGGTHFGSSFGNTRVGAFGGSSLGQAQGVYGSYRTYPAATLRVSRPNNLWSEQSSLGRVNPSYGQTGAGSYRLANRGTGSGYYPSSSTSSLYPGANGANLPSYNRDASGRAGNGQNLRGRGNDGYHYGDHNHRGYGRYGYGYNPYYLNGGLYPYYGGYGYYSGDFGYASDYGDIGAPGAAGNLTPDLSTYDGGSQPVTRYSVDGPNYNSVPTDPSQVPPAASNSEAPRTDQPESAVPSTSVGPDSMVEAVQDELAKRGYYKGKVDALFLPATKDAIRRFQTDNHLVATGLLNSATLTMLGLN